MQTTWGLTDPLPVMAAASPEASCLELPYSVLGFVKTSQTPLQGLGACQTLPTEHARSSSKPTGAAWEGWKSWQRTLGSLGSQLAGMDFSGGDCLAPLAWKANTDPTEVRSKGQQDLLADVESQSMQQSTPPGRDFPSMGQTAESPVALGRFRSFELLLNAPPVISRDFHLESDLFSLPAMCSTLVSSPSSTSQVSCASGGWEPLPCVGG